MSKTPVIRFKNTDEMIVIRETLRALGYTIYETFEGATDDEGFDAVKIDAKQDDVVARCRAGHWHYSDDRVYFDTLQDYLLERFVGKAARDKKLEDLRARETQLAVQLSDVKTQIGILLK